jgi:RNA polymerase sigma factor (sigma-70 family)
VRVQRRTIRIMTKSPRGRRSRFDTTEWSVVLAAGDENSSAARTALATLCETYWCPLYAYVRRQGRSADDARDLTQAFFAQFLEKQAVHEVRRERGRFRSFLLASLRNFLLNDAEHQRTLKRGGGQVALSLDFQTAERRYLQEPHDPRTPERIFDRRWGLTVLDRVLRQLRREWLNAGKAVEFDRLKACLAGESPAGGYRELGQALGLTEGAVKVTVHRLRRQYQRRLREEIRRTVLTDDAVDEEIRYLLSALKT